MVGQKEIAPEYFTNLQALLENEDNPGHTCDWVGVPKWFKKNHL